mmetsp:Transcript_27235/g.48945  ORF Transcript_27235/g.48945 Transcript_27235/m.48945 type:complete len:295 (-) Transcript_27235:12-896(-)
MWHRRFSTFAVDSLEKWKSSVLHAKSPVVVACYANWHEVSLKAIQSLEASKNEAWNLAKLDVELLPKLTSALLIKEIPAHFLVQEGQAKFKSDKWEEVLEQVEILAGLTSPAQLIEARLSLAVEAREQGDFNKSLEIYREVLKKGAGVFEVTARIGQVQVLIASLKYEEASRELDALKKAFPNEWHAPEVQACVKNVREATVGEEKELRLYLILAQQLSLEIGNDPFNAKKLMKLADLHFEYCQYPQAIEIALEAVEIEGKDGAACEALQEMLAVLGPQSKLVEEAWAKLRRIS